VTNNYLAPEWSNSLSLTYNKIKPHIISVTHPIYKPEGQKLDLVFEGLNLD